VALAWSHALIIALVGPVLGYAWVLDPAALFRDGTVLHTVGEGLIVALFAVLAGLRGASRTTQATALALALMSASAILVHLSGGYIELHFHFFVMLTFLALLQDWVPYLTAIVYVAVHHGVVGTLWPDEVYNHTAALNAPWRWAAVHAFFVLWASLGSMIAWRFSEVAVRQRQRAEEGVRQLNDELVERTKQLEAANKELEAFAYTVSHDLKTPLRGMEGFSRALQDDYGDRLDETGHHYLGMIQASARRTGELIDDLLRYSRLERREVGRKPVPLRPLLDRLRAELDEDLQARGLTLALELSVETVEAEPEGLREALANLLGNAVKFSPKGGGTIAVGARRNGDMVVLSVADPGIGFDMKYHDRIFRIFERLHRQEDYTGTGVGLAIVRKVAERHGGSAWAVSEPGKGSTFYLALPAPARAGT
jgi:signal transduction histidine kinase